MSENYGYGEQPENPTRMELAEREKKRQQQLGGWRTTANYIQDTDTVFKSIIKARNDSIDNSIEIPDSLKDITPEQARARGLSEEERHMRNRDFEVRRKEYKELRGSRQ